MKLFRLMLVMFIGLSVAALADDAPVPWVLEFKHVPPKRVLVEDPNPLVGKVAYWYIGYEVTNPFDDAKMLLPEFEIISTFGTHYLDSLYPDADELAQIRDNVEYMDCVEMRGLIEPGETKRGIAIFRQLQRDTNKFSVYVTGLSATTVQEVNEDSARMTIKVLRADYYWPGDRYHFDPERFELLGTDWEVRNIDIRLGLETAE